MARKQNIPERQISVRNQNGNEFIARIVRKGQAYGRGHCLTHDTDRPMIEFYDADYDFDRVFGVAGQFTGARYYLETFVEHEGPLNLLGGESKWVVDAPAVLRVQLWVCSYPEWMYFPVGKKAIFARL